MSGHHKNHWRQSLACRMGSLFLAVLREQASRYEDEGTEGVPEDSQVSGLDNWVNADSMTESGKLGNGLGFLSGEGVGN